MLAVRSVLGRLPLEQHTGVGFSHSQPRLTWGRSSMIELSPLERMAAGLSPAVPAKQFCGCSSVV